MLRFNYPRLPKSSLLYGYHHSAGRRHRGLVIVECPWGVLRLAQLDIPAVALLGTHLSATGRASLRELPRAVLMMDGDDAGRRAATRIKAQLPPSCHVVTLRLAPDHDPDDLDDERLRSVRRFLPSPAPLP